MADIAKAERVGNLLDRQGRTFQPQPCFMDDALLDQLTRRLGELAAADVVQPVRRNADCLGVSTDKPAIAEVHLDQLPEPLQNPRRFALCVQRHPFDPR